MGFVGVYRAIYDYDAQADNELTIKEGDLLLILEKPADDNWWKAKKKATEEDEDEPDGVIPNNYIEEVQKLHNAKALYDYERQSDEEISFQEEAILQVYDTTDEDWTLVGFGGEYGFAPAIYIEATTEEEQAAPPKPQRPQPAAATSPAEERSIPSPAASPVQSPAAALAGIIQQKTGGTASAPVRTVQFTPEASDEEASPPPSLPQRPTSIQIPKAPARQEPPGVMASPQFKLNGDGSSSPGGYHLYNIHEMISHMGKNKKMPTTLGINVGKGVIMIAPEKSRDGPQAEWTAEKLTHYSIEGKHVFMELVRPSKSIDFHAGAKDTANEIVAALGELAGAARAEGLREVLAAGSGHEQKKGKMLYEFMAQGDDEVTVAVGDEVIVIDDTQSEDWWMIKRLKNGKQGVVPSSYVEITGTIPAIPAPTVSKRSTVEFNRKEEERLTKEAARSSSRDDSMNDLSRKGKRGSKQSSSKPNPAHVRTWTDRSGNFKIDAEFIGLKDGKIHLHKLNTVKIAVPVSKMSVEDLEYVERITGLSLEDDKPLADVRRRSMQLKKDSNSNGRSNVGATVQAPAKAKYDWFEFFLACGVDPQICQRYSSAFERDQMGEENLQDIEPTLLRTLGLKEGDILRVMKHLDSKYSRTRASAATGEGNTDSGLFVGADGTLRNNTRKGRPSPATQNSDTVDPRIFEQDSLKKSQPSESLATPLANLPASEKTTAAGSGFDDNAWDLKPTLSTPSSRVSSPPAAMAASPQRPTATGAAAELSQLSISTPALQPSLAPQPAPATQPQQLPAVQQAVQPTGADTALFNQVSQVRNYSQPQPQQQQQQASVPRQRPQAPQMAQAPGSLIPPPPSRPLSAPQTQPSAFQPPPLSVQMTGVQGQPAPLGQSLNEMNQQRFQQQSQMYSQPTGVGMGGFGQQFQPVQQSMQPQPTGFAPFQQNQPTGFPQQQFNNNNMVQPQQQQQSYPTNFAQQPQMYPQATGVNAFLPPALQPQQTGINGFNQQSQQQQQQQQQPTPLSQLPPVPPIPQMSAPAPLVPQKTGPAPSIRFGVTGGGAQKLVPQRTGRANLSQATPQNPFGF